MDRDSELRQPINVKREDADRHPVVQFRPRAHVTKLPVVSDYGVMGFCLLGNAQHVRECVCLHLVRQGGVAGRWIYLWYRVVNVVHGLRRQEGVV